jgi:exodeoxyribonuclease VII large subunit
MTNVLTVTELNAEIRFQLSSHFSDLLVLGEIGELTFAKSGHVYFTLKDANSQLSGVIWKSNWQKMQKLQKFKLENGLQFICRGDISVYEARGAYQLNVRFLQPHGEGPLELAFRQLKEKLAAEGLFDPARKRPLPAYPRRVAIVTSPTGAAIQDFLQTVTRRWPNLHLILLPVLVQGNNAARQIAGAIDSIRRFAEWPDALVLARGGGSLEDLWSFNEESVCRAIFACPVPVLTGIGHETDLTLADLVADVRALTPTDAALRLVPDQQDLQAQLADSRQRLVRAIQVQYQRAERSLASLADRPVFTRPLEKIEYLGMELDRREQQLSRAIRKCLEQNEGKLAELSARLQALSPLAVLQRGYSLTADQQGKLISAAESSLRGETIVTQLSQGKLFSRVERVETEVKLRI